MPQYRALLIALLLAGCATSAPLPPPPPPPPPPIALPSAGEAMPRAEQDRSYIEAFARRSGLSYTSDQVRLNMFVLFAERAKRANLPGFSMIWGDRGLFYVNLKPPIDRAAILALAAPELRPFLRIRAVRFNAAELETNQTRLGEAIKSIGGSWALSYNPQTDRFEIGIDADKIEQALALIPEDLAPYVDVVPGGVILVSKPSARTGTTLR
jgi:hypothetical protein